MPSHVPQITQNSHEILFGRTTDPWEDRQFVQEFIIQVQQVGKITTSAIAKINKIYSSGNKKIFYRIHRLRVSNIVVDLNGTAYQPS